MKDPDLGVSTGIGVSAGQG